MTDPKLLRVPARALGAGRRELPDSSARYVARVHRLAVGDRVLLFDPSARVEATATIVGAASGRVEVDVDAPRPAHAIATRQVTLMQAIGKADKMDAVVRDATELGATRIVPVETRRTVVRLGDRAGERVERWRRIAIEAARQSGRADAPEIGDVASFEEAIAGERSELRVVLSPGADDTLGWELAAAGDGASIALAVGPEGGFDPGEIDRARDAGFVVASLGPRVLRTETVAAAVLGAIVVLDGVIGS